MPKPDPDQTKQVMAFAEDVDKLIDRYRREFSLTLASAVGVLEIAKLHLYMEQAEKDDRTR